MLLLATACVLAYLLGSIPFAVVVSRAMGLPDPRSYGSSNPGATNVLRSGSKAAALLTLVGDAAKGWLAVWLAGHYGLPAGLGAEGVALVALAVFLGHVFSVWLAFQGGKGVATAAGVLLGLDWQLGVLVLGVWIVVVAASRYSSLGALVAALAAPVATGYSLGWGWSTLAVAAMSLILIWRHQSNLAKLWRGEESRLGERKRAAEPAGEPTKGEP